MVLATLTVHYWNELNVLATCRLGSAIDDQGTLLNLSAAGSANAGDFVQVESEVMRVDAVEAGGSQYRVSRGMHSSPAANHSSGAVVYSLRSKTVIAAFPAKFFGSPYSGSWSQAFTMPDVRVASAELFVTNRVGDSPVRRSCFTSALDRGVRTLSGGQYSIQVDGYLAVDDCVAPALVVDTAHSVRDVFAVLGSAADAEIRISVRVDGSPYCELSIPTGAMVSTAVNGADSGPLAAGARLTAAVLTVGQVYPGANLTVLVRL